MNSQPRLIANGAQTSLVLATVDVRRGIVKLWSAEKKFLQIPLGSHLLSDCGHNTNNFIPLRHAL